MMWEPGTELVPTPLTLEPIVCSLDIAALSDQELSDLMHGHNAGGIAWVERRSSVLIEALLPAEEPLDRIAGWISEEV